MQITILSLNKETKIGPSGKPYTVLDIAFKNNTFQGKVEGKKLMEFGANKGAYDVLKNVQSGTYEITVVKNDKGFNDWTNAVLSGSPVSGVPEQTYQPKAANVSGAVASSANRSTYETPEERQRKQVSITRLATLNTAVATLTVGSKNALRKEDVLALAREYENYVFNIPTISDKADGFSDMSDDIPE